MRPFRWTRSACLFSFEHGAGEQGIHGLNAMNLNAWISRLALIVLATASCARAAPPIETYGRLPALEFVRLSPLGDRIAFVAVDGEDRRLFVRKVGGDALVTSSVGTSKVRNIEWAGDDFVLVSLSTTLRLGDKRLDN